MRGIQSLRTPTIAAFGEWSQSNIGDHAIHEGVLEFFRERGWCVHSYDFGGLRPARTPQSSTDEPARWRPSAATLNALPAAKRALRAWRQQFLIQNLRPALSLCDAICVGGGALLMDDNLHFPQSLAVLLRAARELEKPLLCLGCGAEGEWSTRGQTIVREFLEGCSFVALRDCRSAARASELLGREVPVFGDFALRIDTASVARKPPRPVPRYLLAINAAHISASHDAVRADYEDSLCQVVTRAIARLRRPTDGPRAIAVFTTGTAQDVTPAERLQAHLKSLGAQLHLGRSLWQLRRLLQESDAVIATRLHASVIALAERVPVVGYSVTPKLGNFFHTLGLDEYQFGPSKRPDAVVAALLRARREGQRPAAPALAQLQSARAAASKHLAALTLAVQFGEATTP